MINLYEVHECTIDEKGRVLLPRTFRNQLGKHADKGFVIKRSIFSKSLDLYPASTWNHMVSGVQKLNRFVKKNVEFIRLFNAGVREAGMDKSGRFLIPRDLMRYAGLKKNLVMSSATDHIEIWDKSRYEKFMRDNSNRFEKLAEEVMGQTSAGPDDK